MPDHIRIQLRDVPVAPETQQTPLKITAIQEFLSYAKEMNN